VRFNSFNSIPGHFVIGTAFLLTIACGCGNGRLPCIKVPCEVMVGGEPYGPVTVRMQRDNAEKGAPISIANIDSSGKGTFSTYEQNDGLPVGTYKAAVMPTGTGETKVDKTYMNINSSPLIAQVFQNSDKISLKLDVPKKPVIVSIPGLPPNIKAMGTEELMKMATPPKP
jgi:hypothetical protein